MQKQDKIDANNKATMLTTMATLLVNCVTLFNTKMGNSNNYYIVSSILN